MVEAHICPSGREQHLVKTEHDAYACPVCRLNMDIKHTVSWPNCLLRKLLVLEGVTSCTQFFEEFLCTCVKFSGCPDSQSVRA